MLQISEEHLAIADEIARKNFHQRLRDYVRDKLPEETDTTPDSKLLAYITEQDQIAGEHEIKTEQGIARWVCLSLREEENFHQQPKFKDYFEYPGKPPAEKRLELYVDYFCSLEKDPTAKVGDSLDQNGFMPPGRK